MAFTAQWEGGFVDDPKDPGGATAFGISLRFLRALPLDLGDLDGDGDIDADDILCLDAAGARALYRAHFWDALGLEHMGGVLVTGVFDTAVNMGPRTAALILQRALGDTGTRVVEDGVLGPETMAAAKAAMARARGSRGGRVALADRFCVRRIEVYAKICEREVGLRRFLAGWVNRTLALCRAMVDGPF